MSEDDKGKIKVKKSWIEKLFSPIIPGSVKSSVLSLCSITLGSGVLSLPLAVYTCGLALGMDLLIIGGLICSFYYKILIKASDMTKQYTHAGIAEALFGFYFKRGLEIGIILHCFGVVCAYQAIMSSFLCSVLHSFGVLAQPDDDQLRVTAIILINIFVIFPLSLFKEFSALRYASSISVISCIYITLVILFQTPAYLATNPGFMNNIKLFDFNIYVVDAMSITLFAYESSRAIPIIYQELNKRNYNRMSKVIDRGNGLMIVLYTVIGVFGFFSYMNKMPNLVVFRQTLDGTPNAYDWPMVYARLGVAMTIMMSIPMNINPTRLALTQIISGTNYKEDLARHVGLTAMLLFGSVLVAIAIPDAIFYFKILGGIFSVIMGVIYPCLIQMYLPESFTTKIVTVVLTVIVSLIGFSSVVITINSIS
ncbi:unnamed protein product [Blepharisma stoltei]|uniref:Amino acid transporter transmembrane domain-containing protein n=1 Tax=Blepharisma stoltei TaxID=1481888 RepID=A0AAU9IM06_9CILI|nr:unnamed protein product [Blepharisma stoltei]